VEFIMLNSFKTILALFIATLTSAALAKDVKLTLNDQEYFEAQGVNVLAFSNWYNGLFSDSKISGVELIHHGMRTVTNGDVRLHSTPEQWDDIPAMVERKVDVDTQTVESFMRYEKYDFEYSVKVQPQKTGVKISVVLSKPVPTELQGRAGFNLEFLPAAYFERAFIMDDMAGTFPVYPSGPKERTGVAEPEPLAHGKNLVVSPEAEIRRVSISSLTGELSLYDGRSKAQNGWFVVRELLPVNKTGEVLSWKLHAGALKNWLREPVIGHSQVGYHPKQKKVAVIELDKLDKKAKKAALIKVNANGKQKIVKQEKPKEWGRYKRYNYRQFDFTEVTEPGLYLLQYGDVKTAPFRIDSNVYEKAWHPTLEVYMPVQMDHMLINEAYRVWHGASHLDDARQAPVNHKHFDLYAQGPTTDTQYKPGEHVPGLNIGGWYDAGDYDIRTQTQYHTVRGLVDAWEAFSPKRDTTRVDYDRRYVDLHVADGKPDLLQQIEHGTLALIAQHRAFGRAVSGIIVPDITQYTHLGDGLTMTDNMIYSEKMSELESNGLQSGKPDDRWVFTSRSSALNYGSMAALAGASRALKGYNDKLAKECLDTAVAAWAEEQSHEPYVFNVGNTTGGPLKAEMLVAAAELLITTGDKKYAAYVKSALPEFKEMFMFGASILAKAAPYMDDEYRQALRKLAENYAANLKETMNSNPYGVMITEGGWAGNGFVMMQSVSHYHLHKLFPDLFDRESVLRGLNYLYGTHPHSNISFVSNVGTVSKRVAYGMNRADFSFISGGIVPGVLILKPDFPENKENWPFLWGENEYVISLAAGHIFAANAANDLLNGLPEKSQ